MTNRNTSRRIALAVIAFHFVIVVLHSIAHEVLSVKASPAQLSFIIPVIIVAPVLAGFILAKRYKAGALLLATSMLGSLVFGLYYHFIKDTIDHVSHVAQLQPALWSQMFQVTAYLLAISELFGTVVGSISLLGQRQSLKGYAARTDF